MSRRSGHIAVSLVCVFAGACDRGIPTSEIALEARVTSSGVGRIRVSASLAYLPNPDVPEPAMYELEDGETFTVAFRGERVELEHVELIFDTPSLLDTIYTASLEWTPEGGDVEFSFERPEHDSAVTVVAMPAAVEFGEFPYAYSRTEGFVFEWTPEPGSFDSPSVWDECFGAALRLTSDDVDLGNGVATVPPGALVPPDVANTGQCAASLNVERSGETVLAAPELSSFATTARRYSKLPAISLP